jgi:hypothetical protein
MQAPGHNEAVGDPAAAIAAIYETIRPYMPGVGWRLLGTYGAMTAGFALVGLAITAIRALVPGALDASLFGSLAASGLLLLGLILGWRLGERRFRGTALFASYVLTSRARREARNAVARQVDDDDLPVHDAIQRYRELAHRFRTMAREAGITPAVDAA